MKDFRKYVIIILYYENQIPKRYRATELLLFGAL